MAPPKVGADEQIELKQGGHTTLNCDVLNPDAKSFGADCDRVADGVVVHNERDSNPHFNDAARGLPAILRDTARANNSDAVASATNTEPSASGTPAFALVW